MNLLSRKRYKREDVQRIRIGFEEIPILERAKDHLGRDRACASDRLASPMPARRTREIVSPEGFDVLIVPNSKLRRDDRIECEAFRPDRLGKMLYSSVRRDAKLRLGEKPLHVQDRKLSGQILDSRMLGHL